MADSILGQVLNVLMEKIGKDLTPEARSHIAPKNFAVSAKKSNTGHKAYPIEDKHHAVVALGLSKMHGDKADIAEVKKDVAAKYPDLVHKEAAVSKALFNITKVAFSVTEKGHKFDADVARMREQQAADTVGLLQKHHVMDPESVMVLKPHYMATAPFNLQSMHELRHANYVAGKHEKGQNAYNPLGGMMTPSPREEGGTVWRYGKIKKDVAAKGKEKDSNMGMGTYGPGSAAPPGMMGGPPPGGSLKPTMQSGM